MSQIRKVQVKLPAPNPRLNARGEEIPDSEPMALLLGRDKPLTLKERILNATDRGWYEGEDNDDDFEFDDHPVSHLPTSTPFSEGFSPSDGISEALLRKTYGNERVDALLAPSQPSNEGEKRKAKKPVEAADPINPASVDDE